WGIRSMPRVSTPGSRRERRSGSKSRAEPGTSPSWRILAARGRGSGRRYPRRPRRPYRRARCGPARGASPTRCLPHPRDTELGPERVGPVQEARNPTEVDLVQLPEMGEHLLPQDVQAGVDLEFGFDDVVVVRADRLLDFLLRRDIGSRLGDLDRLGGDLLRAAALLHDLGVH